jgi:hypothetical protein
MFVRLTQDLTQLSKAVTIMAFTIYTGGVEAWVG